MKYFIYILIATILCGGLFFGKNIYQSRTSVTEKLTVIKKIPSEPKIKKGLSDEVLKEQIGQMIMTGFRGTDVTENSDIYDMIKNVKIGGVVLFDYDMPTKKFVRNIISYEQTKKLISDIQKYSEIPMFIAVDAEGGKINRLNEKYGFFQLSRPKKWDKIKLCKRPIRNQMN